MIYGVLHLGYFLIPDPVLRDVIMPVVVVEPSAWLINLIAETAVRTDANMIRSGSVVMEVVRGCDGSGTFFLTAAAVLSFPTSWRLRLIGLVAGLALMYCVNLVRIASLYFIAAADRSLFHDVHTFIAPSLVVVIALTAYAFWVRRAAQRVPAPA